MSTGTFDERRVVGWGKPLQTAEGPEGVSLRRKGSGTWNPMEGETRLALCVPRGKTATMGARYREAGLNQRLKRAV